MKPTLHRVLRILAVAFYLAVSSHSAGAGPSQNSPEIVRLSHAEGDIRVSEGSSGKVTLDGPWSVAAAGLPIEGGFTIATGTGRAEIEFESGWTIYLADNSTLEFTDLNVRNNVPDSKIVLLAGTLSVYFKPAEDEKLSLETPFAKALLTTPESFRVESFLDALSVTSLETSGTKVDADQNPDVFLEKGQTIVYTEGAPAQIKASESMTPTAWDQWVSTRVSAREAAVSAGLKASGLASPIPGLADLYNGGRFFDCAPFGRCWEPALDLNTANSIARSTPGAIEQSNDFSTGGQQVGQQPAPPNSGKLKYFTRRYPNPDCSETLQTVRIDPATGKERILGTFFEQGAWNSAICHSGGFVYTPRHGYVWVVGRKHHHPRCHWVKFQGKTGYVPAHPQDVKGRAPLNLAQGVFVASTHNSHHYKLAQMNEHMKVDVLSAAPKQFQTQERAELVTTARPLIQAHFWEENSSTSRTQANAAARASITYDYSRQSFVTEVPKGAGRGTYQAVVGQVNSHGGFTAGGSHGYGAGGGGRSGGSSSGGGSSGGGGRSSGGSGGYSGGGGGGHSSGGGGGYSGGGYSGGGSSGSSGGGGGNAGGGGRSR
jgi:hypothetical protein